MCSELVAILQQRPETDSFVGITESPNRITHTEFQHYSIVWTTVLFKVELAARIEIILDIGN